VCYQRALFHFGSNALEDGPQYNALHLWKPGLSSEPRYIAIIIPIVQLPRIYDLRPFGEKKMQTKLVAVRTACGVFHKLANYF
jgi:hypothetical protein